jgi:hypothetical protein
LRLADLVVGRNCERGLGRVERAFGGIGRGVDDGGSNFLQRQVAGGKLCRVHLNADRRVPLTADKNHSHA